MENKENNNLPVKSEIWKWIKNISDNPKPLIVPEFQRKYIWNEEDVSIFLKDILESRNYNFIGTFVFKIFQFQENTFTTINEFHIIDGQQRITTLFLIFISFLNNIEKELDSDLFKNIKKVIYLDNSNSKNDSEDLQIKLQLIKDDQEKLNDLLLKLKNGYGNYDEFSVIDKNYKVINELISNYLKYNSKDSLWKKLSSIIISVITLEEGINAQEFFEKTNYLGKRLNEIDLIKNFILFDKYSSKNGNINNWKIIEEKFKNQNDLENFFMDYLLVKSSKRIKKNEIYKKFKEYYKTKHNNNKNILEDIKYYSNLYTKIIYKENNENELLYHFKEVGANIFFPLVLILLKKRNECLKDKNKIFDIDKIFKLLISYYIRKSVANQIINTNFVILLFSKLKNIINSNENKIFDAFVNVFKEQENNENKFIINNDFASYLRKWNGYKIEKNKKITKFILIQIENNKNKEKVLLDKNITIEHIMPQSKRNFEWKEEVGKNFDEIHFKYLNNLGNLTLTGVNSELKDKGFAEKKEEYKKSKFRKLNEDIINQDNWNEKSIINRLNKLIAEIIHHFPSYLENDEYSNSVIENKVFKNNENEILSNNNQNNFENFFPKIDNYKKDDVLINENLSILLKNDFDSKENQKILFIESNLEKIKGKKALYLNYKNYKFKISSFAKAYNFVLEILFSLDEEKMYKFAKINSKTIFDRTKTNKKENINYIDLKFSNLTFFANLNSENTFKKIINILQFYKIKKNDFSLEIGDQKHKRDENDFEKLINFVKENENNKSINQHLNKSPENIINNEKNQIITFFKPYTNDIKGKNALYLNYKNYKFKISSFAKAYYFVLEILNVINFEKMNEYAINWKYAYNKNEYKKVKNKKYFDIQNSIWTFYLNGSSEDIFRRIKNILEYFKINENDFSLEISDKRSKKVFDDILKLEEFKNQIIKSNSKNNQISFDENVFINDNLNKIKENNLENKYIEINFLKKYKNNLIINKKPLYFTYENNKIKVNSFIKLISNIFDILNAIDKEKMIQFAKINYKFIYLKSQKSDKTSHKFIDIKDSDYKFNGYGSSNKILNNIKRILKFYNINKETFSLVLVDRNYSFNNNDNVYANLDLLIKKLKNNKKTKFLNLSLLKEVKNLKIISFSYKKNKLLINSFRELYISFMNLLEKINIDKIYELAKQDFVFTLDINKKFYNSAQINNSNIIYDINLSANTIVNKMKKLISKFNLNEQDFILEIEIND
ncbi:DUF262 domain-containing protein [Mesomycoplasma lagogenitalium]|uniref:DUF262 domain-containing protein n=1 Tax=Mesomycoplasma lagogenitalium TaxID=171286 RepID=A0ABY8LUX5_9BACT|nr:DUF262 domain-containing protein [Mesomycoplasma lagogenitalium]WGI37037.1 DUF262 domain-containing protein [Mesomycoplasma lagogenitalium]